MVLASPCYYSTDDKDHCSLNCYLCILASELVIKQVSDLNVEANHTSCCTRIRLQPGVTLDVTEIKIQLLRLFVHNLRLLLVCPLKLESNCKFTYQVPSINDNEI